MPRIPYRYPAAGTDAIADAIRERRGAARGLTHLDGMLLNAPPIAAGWNSLLGAVRTKNSLPDDVRELMILRVAARNRAAYEWEHHEGVARAAGLTDAQLARVGDVSLGLHALSAGAAGAQAQNSSDAPAAPASPILSRLQSAALAFAEASTAHVQVPDAVFGELKEALRETLPGGSSASAPSGAGSDAAAASEAPSAAEALLNQKLAEACATVATYNMVSRFLVSTDIDDKANAPCAVPSVPSSGAAAASAPRTPNARIAPTSADGTFPHALAGSALAYAPSVRHVPSASGDGTTRAVRVHFHSVGAPWLLLINSLMTNQTMWDWVLPALRAAGQGYNVATYDQAGHGLSGVPADVDSGCTMHTLADDAARVLDALGVSQAHAVIGVSQGGATALSFGVRHAQRARRIVACDTQAATPAANVAAWDERIALARTGGDGGEGMRKLADVTVARWFDASKGCSAATKAKVRDMVVHTPVEGFVAGARALQRYDLLADGLVAALQAKRASDAASAHPCVLLVAGEHDGAIPKALHALQAQLGDATAQFTVIPDAGHLPMCDNPQAFADAVLPFLQAP